MVAIQTEISDNCFFQAGDSVFLVLVKWSWSYVSANVLGWPGFDKLLKRGCPVSPPPPPRIAHYLFNIFVFQCIR